MNIKLFREVIQEREYVETISQGEWAEGIENCCNKEIDILAEDINSTINFLKNDCTAKEFVWISEIIEDLAEKTKSHALIACYKSLVVKFPEECQNYCIEESIKNAEAALIGDENSEQK
jgi:hypothetical protein